jgi:hypothetical protein
MNKFTLGLLLIIAFVVALWGGIIFLVVHFAHKYW